MSAVGLYSWVHIVGAQAGGSVGFLLVPTDFLVVITLCMCNDHTHPSGVQGYDHQYISRDCKPLKTQNPLQRSKGTFGRS